MNIIVFVSSQYDVGNIDKEQLAKVPSKPKMPSQWLWEETSSDPNNKDPMTHYIDQGWPNFLCSGQKNGLKKLGGHKNVSKKAWRTKYNCVKTNNRASLTFKEL